MEVYIITINKLGRSTEGIWIAHKGLINETFSFMVGFLFVSSIVTFVDIMRYEREYGPLYVKSKPFRT